ARWENVRARGGDGGCHPPVRRQDGNSWRAPNPRRIPGRGRDPGWSRTATPADPRRTASGPLTWVRLPQARIHVKPAAEGTSNGGWPRKTAERQDRFRGRWQAIACHRMVFRSGTKGDVGEVRRVHGWTAVGACLQARADGSWRLRSARGGGRSALREGVHLLLGKQPV